MSDEYPSVWEQIRKPTTPSKATIRAAEAIRARLPVNSFLSTQEIADIIADYKPLRGEMQPLREAVEKLLNHNGGPIGKEETVDGLDYVMVRLDDFKALCAALEREKQV